MNSGRAPGRARAGSVSVRSLRGRSLAQRGRGFGRSVSLCYLFLSRAVPAWIFHVATQPIFFLTPALPGVTVSSRLRILPPEVTGPGTPRLEAESWISRPIGRATCVSVRAVHPDPPPVLCVAQSMNSMGYLCLSTKFTQSTLAFPSCHRVRVLCSNCPSGLPSMLVCRTSMWPCVPSRMPELFESIQIFGQIN